jgi:hypothetical protein
MWRPPARYKEMQAEVDRCVAANGVVMPDSGYNAPHQVPLNNWPILVQPMWPVVMAAVVVVGLLLFGLVRLVRRRRA